MSLRLRLLLASLSTLAIGMGALLVVGNVLLDKRVDSEVSSTLRAHALAMVSALDVFPERVTVRETANDATLDQQSWVVSRGVVLERPARAPAELDRFAVRLARTARGATEVAGPDRTRFRAESVRAPGTDRVVGTIVVVFSTVALEQLEQGVLIGSVVFAGLLLLAGALAVRTALDGALRPVAQMTASVEAWGAQDLDRRFALGPPKDELTSLAATLDGLLARIAASRRHEQRFAAEVAHELRTPLAGLRLQAELALDAEGAGADDERRAALEAVVVSATRLGGAIDSLLAVARREIDPATGSVDLAAIAREYEDIELRSPARVPLAEGDPDVVRRALAPIVENARRHARSTVRFELGSVNGHVRLSVHDDGPGLDPMLGERAFDPGVRGSREVVDHHGAGLGLPLARRLARSCGGDVIVGAPPGGTFILELPALSAPG